MHLASACRFKNYRALVWRCSMAALTMLGSNVVALWTYDCPVEPKSAAVPLNSTRIFFIGAHHTGTETYYRMFRGKNHEYFSDLLAEHNPSWPYSPEVWFQANVLSDSPYVPLSEWNLDQFEFGHKKHPNVRLLFQCFPNALFVLNTRSLRSWVRSKVKWEASTFRMRNYGRPLPPCDSPRYPRPSWHKDPVKNARASKGRDMHSDARTFESDMPTRPNTTDPLYASLGSRMCDVTMAREELHLLYLTFVAEDPLNRLPRFLIVDLPAEGYAGASLRLCRFLATWQVKPVGTCNILAKSDNMNGHSSHHTNDDCENDFIAQALTKNSTRNSTKPMKACISMKALDFSDLESPYLSRNTTPGAFENIVDDMRQRYTNGK